MTPYRKTPEIPASNEWVEGKKRERAREQSVPNQNQKHIITLQNMVHKYKIKWNGQYKRIKRRRKKRTIHNTKHAHTQTAQRMNKWTKQNEQYDFSDCESTNKNGIPLMKTVYRIYRQHNFYDLNERTKRADLFKLLSTLTTLWKSEGGERKIHGFFFLQLTPHTHTLGTHFLLLFLSLLSIFSKAPLDFSQ